MRARTVGAAVAGLAILSLGCAAGTGRVAHKTPVPLFSPEPVYPQEALKQRQPGEVVVAVMVDDMGISRDVHLVSEEPAGKGFGEAARQAVTTWVWSPAIMGGVSVGESVRMAVQFDPARPVYARSLPVLEHRTDCPLPAGIASDPEPLAVAEVDVGADGAPIQVRIIRVTPDGNRLERAAKDCIEGWRWEAGNPGTTCIVLHFAAAPAGKNEAP